MRLQSVDSWGAEKSIEFAEEAYKWNRFSYETEQRVSFPIREFIYWSLTLTFRFVSISFIISRRHGCLRVTVEIFYNFFFSGEHILLFLTKTVARQSSEQGQYISNKSSDSKSRSANVRSIGTPALPAHDLEPPKFAKLALEHTLKDWKALRSMLMFGSNVDQLKSR